MHDISLVKEILNQIELSLLKILTRFESIKAPNDFLVSPLGNEKLDSICMQLIVIGESLKNVDKITNFELLKKYPQIEWSKVKGLRDIISHHYFDINHEAIFDICDDKIHPLLDAIQKILAEL